MTRNPNRPPDDDELLRLLESCRSVPPRDADAAQRGKAAYLAAVAEVRAMPRRGRLAAVGGLLAAPLRWRPSRPLAMAMLVALVVLGTSSGLAVAAGRSLPGDALYPIKRALEGARVAMPWGEVARLKLRLLLADRRVEEAQGLVELQRYEQIPAVTADLDEQLRIATEALNALAQGSPDRAHLLGQIVRSRAAHQRSILADILDDAPEASRPALTRALESAERAEAALAPPEGAPDAASGDDGSPPAEGPPPSRDDEPGRVPAGPPPDEEEGPGTEPPGRAVGREEDPVPPGHESRDDRPAAPGSRGVGPPSAPGERGNGPPGTPPGQGRGPNRVPRDETPEPSPTPEV